MAGMIHPKRLNHINMVVEDFAACRAHLERVYGAEFLMDLPQAEWHAGLIAIGRVIFEPFAPPAFLLNARYGPHYLGVEYQADMAEVREAVSAQGIRIVRDIGVALHTHPADCFGVAFEFYDGGFHDNDWPLIGGRMRPQSYWRDAHPLGINGLKGYTLAVADLDAASLFLCRFLDATFAYEAPRPAIAAHGIGLRVADAIVELLTPSGDGPLARHLHRHGEGIRSTVFAVRDVAATRHHLATQGLALTDGTAPDSFAVAPEASLGLVFEFEQT